MQRFRIHSIKGKLVALVAVTCTAALLIACIAFVVNDIRLTRELKARQLTAAAVLLASNSSAAVSFEQAEAAEELLQSLEKISTIQYARLTNSDGESLASYSRDKNRKMDEYARINMSPGHLFTQDGYLDVMVRVVEEEEAIGALYIRASLDDLWRQVTANIWGAVIILTTSLLVAIVMTFRLQKVVSTPILNLANVAEQISNDGNYSIRVQSNCSGEINALYIGFNRMLEEIEKGQMSLEHARDQLELRVEERTSELSQANEKLRDEFEERERMNAHMVELSHRAGKAEIATGVLHNVGNVLNSINVSASLVAETLQLSRLPSLERVVDLLNSQDDITEFFTNTDQGRVLPDYLERLTGVLKEEQDTAVSELDSLAKHLDHVKTIVAMQQSYAGVSALKEWVTLSELIDDAEALIESSLKKHDIKVIREFADLPQVKVEKQKLLQVIVNLLQNAKDAMTEGRQEDRTLTIATEVSDQDRLLISFTDNGIGIEAENLTRIFSHGFTTKPDGHGFGLHSCANALQEMRGNLSVNSEGTGHGATFSVALPFEALEESLRS